MHLYHSICYNYEYKYIFIYIYEFIQIQGVLLCLEILILLAVGHRLILMV